MEQASNELPEVQQFAANYELPPLPEMQAATFTPEQARLLGAEAVEPQLPTEAEYERRAEVRDATSTTAVLDSVDQTRSTGLPTLHSVMAPSSVKHLADAVEEQYAIGPTSQQKRFRRALIGGFGAGIILSLIIILASSS